MVHRRKGLFHGKYGIPAHAIDQLAKAPSLKKTICNKIPLAEKACAIARGKDRKKAFLAAVIRAVPKEKTAEVVNLLSGCGIQPKRILAEVRALEKLDKMDISDKDGLSIYEQKIMNNEISVATLIARIVALEAGEEIEPARLIYVYSPIGECVNHNIGVALREKAVSLLWQDTLRIAQRTIADRQDGIRKARDVIDRMIVRLTGMGSGNCRVKNASSAAFKLKTKGHINDLVGSRIILEDIRKAVDTAERIVGFLKQQGIDFKMDDYYRKPTNTNYTGYHINFNLGGVASEIQISDAATMQKIKKSAPHGLYKSYGVLSMGLAAKLANYL